MATDQPSAQTDPNVHVHTITWAGLDNGDDGAPWDVGGGCPNYPEKSVQVTGTFGSGGQCDIEGSNDGTNWALLHDQAGAPLSILAAGIHFIAENTIKVRPNISAGDGTTDLTVMIVGARS